MAQDVRFFAVFATATSSPVSSHATRGRPPAESAPCSNPVGAESCSSCPGCKPRMSRHSHRKTCRNALAKGSKECQRVLQAHSDRKSVNALVSTSQSASHRRPNLVSTGIERTAGRTRGRFPFNKNGGRKVLAVDEERGGGGGGLGLRSGRRRLTRVCMGLFVWLGTGLLCLSPVAPPRA